MHSHCDIVTYFKFAGHECGVALAKMSFDEAYLDDIKGCKELNFGERTELDGWIEKFRDYRCYPVLGRLVIDMPDPERLLTKQDLEENNGSGEVPEGFAAAPIYIGASDKVFDMSFGGVTFYGKGGPYNKFAGKDATRALALMSLDEANLENNSISDCTEKQIKTMNDWIKAFRERKQYPIVGRLEK
jgi:membrane-associated progesterone receptor component